MKSPALHPSAFPWTGLFHLLVVYLVWGSTYLAIRFAVREGSGFPPFFMVGTRLLPAGFLLLMWAFVGGQRIRLSRREWGITSLSGVLLWVGGNGMVTFAEQQAPSGYAALLIGSTPLWTTLMESWADRRRPSGRLLLALAIGFVGLVVLNIPHLMEGDRTMGWSVVVLMFAAISWGAGSLYQQRHPVSVAPLVSSAWQQLFGGLAALALALLVGEPCPHPGFAAWMGWGYLLVFGSILAFTSYIIVLRTLPLSVVTTYAYVNPVTAVVLGWLILKEPVTAWTVAGAALILAGVAGVFHTRIVHHMSRSPKVVSP